MRKPFPIELRIRVRAYYLWLSGNAGCAMWHWFRAEREEQKLAAKRSDAARKGHQTRQARGAEKILVLPKVLVDFQTAVG